MPLWPPWRTRSHADAISKAHPHCRVSARRSADPAVTEAAAFMAWLSAAIIVLADGRRGLALGLGLTAVAFAALAWASGDRLAAAAMLAGGGVAAVQRLRSGIDGWGLMPALPRG